MDDRRAKQIIESLGVIDVKHNGNSVWIENIVGDSAEVTYMNSRKRAEVPLSQLNES